MEGDRADREGWAPVREPDDGAELVAPDGELARREEGAGLVPPPRLTDERLDRCPRGVGEHDVVQNQIDAGLAGQHGWYLKRQLMNFQAGLRGAQPGDDYGALMSNFARTLPDEQAIDDVVSYILTLDEL